MNMKDRINEIDKIEIGYDISLAKNKLDMIDSLLIEIENNLFKEICSVPREDIVSLLQICYGISYEIGNTKQQLYSNLDVEIARRILPIARLIFGKSKELLPYLSLNLHNSIQDKELYALLEEEILTIKNTLLK